MAHLSTTLGGMPLDIAHIIYNLLDCSLLEHWQRPDESRNARKLVRDEEMRDRAKGLVSFCSVNRRIRAWSRPLLFSRIAFGYYWRASGPTCWPKACKRMIQMLHHPQLIANIKAFKLQACAIPLPHREEERHEIWKVVSVFLSSLPELKAIVLDLPPLMPEHLKHVLAPDLVVEPVPLNTPTQRRRRRKLHQLRLWLRRLFGSKRLREDGDDAVEAFTLPQIANLELTLQSLYVSSNSAWFLPYCRGLETFSCLDGQTYFGCNAFLQQLSHSRETLVSFVIKTPVHDVNVPDISKQLTNVETIAVYPPRSTVVTWFGSVFQTLDEEGLVEAIPCFQQCPKLRSLVFIDAPSGDLFEDQTPSKDIQEAIVTLGRGNPTLQSVRLGPWLFLRERDWDYMVSYCLDASRGYQVF